MTISALPEPNTDAWIRLPEAYAGRVADAVNDAGIEVVTWWNDPSDPRDATIRLASDVDHGLALVWDEETGWRYGAFVAGEQGVRTQLAWAAYLADEVLPEPTAVATALRDALEGDAPARTTPAVYRSFRDLQDGLDSRLADYGVVVG